MPENHHREEVKESQIEKWLREEVGPAYDRLMEDPSRGLPLEEVRADLEKAFAKW
jgi:hypothetical protein